MIRLVSRLFGKGKPIATKVSSQRLIPEERKQERRQERKQERQTYGNVVEYFKTKEGVQKLLSKKPSIAEAFQMLRQLKQQSREEWKVTFSKFSYFMEKLFDGSSLTAEQSYYLFVGLTDLLKASGNIRSQSLTRIYNKLLAGVPVDELPLDRLITVLMHTAYFNPPKASHLFLKHRDAIERLSTIEQTVNLMTVLKICKIYPSSLLNTCMDITYERVNQISADQLLTILECFAGSNKVVNSGYLVKLLKRIPKDVTNSVLLHVTSAVSVIQQNMRLDSSYLFDLDTYYEWAFEKLSRRDVSKWSANHLIKLVNCLRRSGYYHERLLTDLVQLHLTAPIQELSEHNEGTTGSPLMLSNVLSLLHLTAVFDLPNKIASYSQFVKYCLAVLQLTQASGTSVKIEQKYIPRTAWSLCVLMPAAAIKRQIWYLMKLIESELTPTKSGESKFFVEGSLYILDSCLTYLRTVDPELCKLIRRNIEALVKLGTESSSENSSQVYASATQKNVARMLLQMGVLCVEEHSVHNLYCDICIPDLGKYRSLFGVDDFIEVPVRNIIIELHGFQHFLRNSDSVKGGSVLKKKLLQAEQYHYYYIPIDEWELASDKKAYLKDFLRKVYFDIGMHRAS